VKESLAALRVDFGEVELRSSSFAFEHTSYYEPEMGKGLTKQFFAFAGMRQPDFLVAGKLSAMRIEQQFSVNGRRKVNIDPFYMELAKIVVASSKNFAHRVYLGQGVYGDVQLRYQHDRYVASDWTYPDYSAEPGRSFFQDVRASYWEQLRSE